MVDANGGSMVDANSSMVEPPWWLYSSHEWSSMVDANGGSMVDEWWLYGR